MNEETKKRLTALKAERGYIKGNLTRFIKFLDKFQTDQTEQLQGRYENIIYNLEHFNKVQLEIELLDTTEIGSDESEQHEDRFYDATARAKKLLKNDQSTNENLQHNAPPMPISDISLNKPNIKLPTMVLPNFNGDYEHWEHFRDMFIALVHSDGAMDNVRKFCYLKGALNGSAARTIQAIKITNDNYLLAWKLLNSKYEDTEIVTRNHIKALVDRQHIQDANNELLNFTDDIQVHIRSLESLGEPVDSWDTLLNYIIYQKLDSSTQDEWEEYLNTKKLKRPKTNELIEFLQERCNMLEKKNKKVESSVSREKFHKNVQFNKPKNVKNCHQEKELAHASFQGGNRNISCVFCKDAHYIYTCDRFKALPVMSRYEKAKQLKLCLNCLRTNHLSKECTSQSCKKCSKRHNTLLHFENQSQSSHQVTVSDDKAEQLLGSSALVSSASENSYIVPSTRQNHSISNHCAKQESHILLGTALVYIRDNYNNWHMSRALIDSGSQPNFITKDLCQKLNFPTSKTIVPIFGVGKSCTSSLSKVSSNIKSLYDNFPSLTFFVLEKITEDLPTVLVDKSKLQIPTNITLADYQFYKPDKIDLLLGAELFYQLLKTDQIQLGIGLPILQNTVLGWIVSGPIPLKHLSQNKAFICNVSTNEALESQLERFWKIEECLKQNFPSNEEKDCEQIFNETTTQNETGRFVVTLPIRENVNELGDSIENAIKRLQSMERKFQRNLTFKQQYVDFMSEYESLGHMEKININRCEHSFSQNTFYLPHHGVLNENSTTTKLRVVFDGSCKSTSGVSLNDKLMVGPVIQDDSFSILVRFRKHIYAINADIAKMYRQVMINNDQQDLQRIVWRTDVNKPIEHYRLKTVTYGTSSASWLAIRSLIQVAINEKHNFALESQIIASDFYVDDLLTGSNTIEEACNLKNNLSLLLNKYGFELRKWVVSDKRILENTETDFKTKYQILDVETKSTLGLWWQANNDLFEFNIDWSEPPTDLITKRVILSSIAKIFDPLGLLAPIIVRAKMLLQKAWQLKIEWDEPAPPELLKSWLYFKAQLPIILNIKIPRCVVTPRAERIEIHGFCDASLLAYGACIYLKSIGVDKTVMVRLLCSKSRVAPLKFITLPRLELCGAVLLCNLYSKVVDALKLNIDSAFFWTDSNIVLSWIASPPNTWKLFVANRVSQIQSQTNSTQWFHISSVENPADLVSRGTEAEKLKTNSIWWTGPNWLSLNQSSWPKNHVSAKEVPEKRKIKTISLNVILNKLDIFERFSSLYRLLRVTALCLRFYKNCKLDKENRKFDELSKNELDETLIVLLRVAQHENFSAEIDSLIKNKTLSKKSRLLSLNPFLDGDGLLRVGGRLTKSYLNYDTKHQYILPIKHTITRLIILGEHHRQLHAGVQAILASLRQKFWLVDGRKAIRSILRHCMVCFRAKPSIISCQMGNLPRDRVTLSRPFLISGVDYAGPFYIKDGKLRNRAIIKAYLCIFVYFSTKAVHLEAVSDLTSASFLNSLKRFVSRRGLCKTLYSDNGTNFVGAHNELTQVVQTINKFIKERKISDYSLVNGIEWKFIPAHSPHHGGLWEAAVKSAKYHITRVVGNCRLTFEDLITVFAQIEAIMNSRPITPISNDPQDLSALTPGHFLIGESLTSIPQPDYTSTPTNRLKYYEHLQQISQHFWQRWTQEYLSSMQQRTKWKAKSVPAISIGDLVVLVEENTPSQSWRLGRIIELHPGPDGLPRVATVRTSTSIVKRAVQKLCLLPIENSLASK